jgi:monoterpene epsilon-lactone hydrolase
MLNEKFVSLIKYVDEKNFPDLESLTVEQARFMSENMLINSFPENMDDKFSDIKKYNTSINNINMRFYYPERANNSLIIFIHGGGFVIGSIKSYDHVCLMLTESTNTNLVSIGYTLSPKLKFPLVHDEVLETVSNIIEQSSQYSNFILCGDSAGANIALYVAEKLENDISQLHLIYPWLDMRLQNDSFNRLEKEGHLFLSKELLIWFRGHYLQENDYLDPKVQHTNKTIVSLPDTYIYACGYDRLYDDSINFHNKMKNMNVETNLQIYPDLVHGSLFYSEYVPEIKMIINDFANNITKGMDIHAL